VEGVAAVGEHAHHVLRLVFLQAHRAAAFGRARLVTLSFVADPAYSCNPQNNNPFTVLAGKRDLTPYNRMNCKFLLRCTVYSASQTEDTQIARANQT
jgi:hypothetical protein